MEHMVFYHINILKQYNYNKNIIDIEDQLRGFYQIDKWTCKRK